MYHIFQTEQVIYVQTWLDKAVAIKMNVEQKSMNMVLYQCSKNEN